MKCRINFSEDKKNFSKFYSNLKHSISIMIKNLTIINMNVVKKEFNHFDFIRLKYYKF